MPVSEGDDAHERAEEIEFSSCLKDFSPSASRNDVTAVITQGRRKEQQQRCVWKSQEYVQVF